MIVLVELQTNLKICVEIARYLLLGKQPVYNMNRRINQLLFIN